MSSLALFMCTLEVHSQAVDVSALLHQCLHVYSVTVDSSHVDSSGSVVHVHRAEGKASLSSRMIEVVHASVVLALVI